MFSLRSVCQSVCLSVCPWDNWKSCEPILTKFLGEAGHGTGTNEFNFSEDPGHRPDPGVRSGFRNPHSLDYRLCWRSAEVCALWALVVTSYDCGECPAPRHLPSSNPQSRAGWGGYTLRVIREMRWVFNRRLKVSNVFDSLIAAGNSFQIVGAEKLKERLPKLVVQKGTDRRFWLAERRHRKGWYMWRRFLRYGGWFVDRLLYVKRAILYWIRLCTGSQWRCVSLLLA